MTRRKLAEAKFFLAHLEEQTRTMQQNWEAFGFYLSAFLCAGRSVPDVLRNELPKQRRGGASKPWYKSWLDKQSQEDRVLWKFMDGQRQAEVHRKGAEVQRDTGLVPITDVWLHRPSGHPHMMMWSIFAQDAPPPQIGVLAPKFDFAGKPVDVVATSRRYVELLESLVRAYEQSDPPRRIVDSPKPLD